MFTRKMAMEFHQVLDSIFLFFDEIPLISARANQKSLQIFHQLQISKLSSFEIRLVPTNLLNLSSFTGLVFKREKS
jgi:hypothetical protein